MKIVALIFGDGLNHLDHLAPLCHFLHIPLIVTDRSVFTAAVTFYPDLVVYEMSPLELSNELVQHFDVVISCLPRHLFDRIVLVSEEVHQKKLLSIWCPHGNSDKGHLSPVMETIDQERLILVYGQKMIDFIKEKNGRIPDYLVVGNYRYHHYLKLKPFYDKWMSRTLSDSRDLLYAPTWDDNEGSSSLKSALPTLQKVGSRLLVKLHPHTLLYSPHLVEQYIGEYEDFYFISTYAPIYPLLERAQAYLGDMSSIGYDYLVFNRPMFFFNPQERSDRDKGLYLHRCGEEMPTSLSNDQSDLHSTREEVYNYTFTKVDPTTLKGKFREKIIHHLDNLRI
ncbi:MAG: CDP-glycerol glycerophosphotransferase family protein [Simkaniaceae bacterium]|nr:CDP-glycerol glycerophosphotransferase family protein [Simkaniaceae bacterium]